MANKPIGTLGTVNTMEVQGMIFADTTNLLILYGQTDGSTNIRSGTRKMGAQGGAAYQVTNGSTLTIYAMEAIANDTSQASLVSVGAAQIDNVNLGFNVSTAFTNPIFFGTENTALGTMYQIVIPTTSSAPYQGGRTKGVVASQKYLGIQQGAIAATSLFHKLYGYEA